MKQSLSLYIIVLSFFVILDFVWFSISLEGFYKPYIGHIFSGNFNYSAAAAFYILYSGGLVYLILLPGLLLGYSTLKILLNGMVLGVVAYGAYDLTNQATIEDWPLIVTLVDMTWGGIVTSVVSGIAYTLVVDHD